MTIPTATYRIQFRNGMTFDRAAALVAFLERLSISRQSASSVFYALSRLRGMLPFGQERR